ncbi:MAG: hypothetical protein LBT84_07780, partial [Spirochaetia bacterium]|nr:hypothetical protein [Spirochaetia bacterium]
YTGYTSLAEKGLLGFYEHRGIWIDAGTSASLRNAEKLLAGEASFIAERTRKALGNCDLN